jgi:hypothetical protein
MNREIHVRFWEGLRVRFPWATHLATVAMRPSTAGAMTLCAGLTGSM